MPRKPLDLSGQRFGAWSVVRRDGLIGEASAFLCVCDCGTERRLVGSSLKSGGTLSCGCLARAALGDRARTHGGWRHPLYRTWMGMHDRCRRETHHAFPSYGGRGIRVCERWADFAAFRADMEPGWRKGLTLDRVDNDGDYSPENCRWATKKEQARNKRATIRITFQGETKSVGEWADETGLAASVIYTRLKKGWTVEAAITKPKREW